jgi:hypothetical protein
MAKRRKGDLIRVKVLRKDCVVQNKWVTPKKFKTMEAVYFHHKHKAITAFVPALKTGKKRTPLKSGGGLTGGHKPVKVFLHVKIIYNEQTVNRYLSKDRHFYLEGVITLEGYADEISNKTIQRLDRDMRERLESHFCAQDHKKTFLDDQFYSLDDQFYESGLEVKDIDREPSSEIEAEVNYRYKKDSLLKSMTL